jgi:hypothetical protein
VRNELVIDQLILFHKPNKKIKSEKKMHCLISQTKRIRKRFHVARSDNGRGSQQPRKSRATAEVEQAAAA